MSTMAQRAFSGGEISPSLYARTDIAKYFTSVRTMRNFYTMRHGGAQNRAGLEFICPVKDSSKNVRLIPFIFSRSVTYILEFGDQYMRVIKNGTQVKETSQAISGITNANPCVVSYVGADNFTNGNSVYISGIVGPIGTYLNGRWFKIASINAGANTFQLQYLDGTPVNSTAFGAYTSGGDLEEVYEIATPYADTDLADIKFVQSADVVTLVHPSFAPRELSRTGDTSWTLDVVAFNPTVSPPAGQAVSNQGSAGATTYNYKITFFNTQTGEESLPTSVSTATGNATMNSTNFNRISWTNPSNADLEVVIYKSINGVFGFIGTAASNSTFDDLGYTADTTDTPPVAGEDFNAVDEYPSAIAYYQQRLCLANTNLDPEKIWTSRVGLFTNFSKSNPLQDDDSISFILAGKQINEIYHLIDIGKLIVLTESGEWAVNGDQSGAILPNQINAKQYTYNGAKPDLSPIVIGSTALYVQARGSIIRDLNFNFETDGYTGNDLTIFSSHLFDNYQISDWAYQQIPHSVLWVVRNDGTLLGCTYLKEQQMLAWHRHDTENGLFKNIATIPGSSEDEVYFVVEREINGETVKYIEKLVSRQFSDVKDLKIMDSHLSYDGRNTDAAHTMTLSEYNSGGWDYTSKIVVTSSQAYFASSEVGNEIHLTDEDGNMIRVSLTEYVSSTVMRGNANKTVPESLRDEATSEWVRAVDSLSGLWHLEGQNVSIFADAHVVANPNNTAYQVESVLNGEVQLAKCYGVIHIGLPITSDIQGLNIDSSQGETIADKEQIVNALNLFVQETRGLWAGSEPPPDEATDFLGGLNEYKLRSYESYDSPVELKTEVIDVVIQSHWNSNGRVFVRQTDPIPCTILAMLPAGRFPFKG